jgi:ribosome-binding protein aMBF1 (putative translation factor)
MTDVQKDTTLDQVKDVIADDMNAWMYYSQAIAATMSNRMEELGMTQRALAEKMNCTQQCLQGVERSRESVIGNFVQNRKCIRYQNTTSWNK